MTTVEKLSELSTKLKKAEFMFNNCQTCGLYLSDVQVEELKEFIQALHKEINFLNKYC